MRFFRLKTLVSYALLLLAALGGQAFSQGTPLAVELLPLGKDIGLTSGQTVTPAYEGWYENADGSISLSFGYYNRNEEEVLEIPVGPANRIIGAPDGDSNQGQPTRFEVDRHWGVFTVVIPAGYDEEVVWHLENQGKTFHVPANLGVDYIVDALLGDANGNMAPEIRFSEDGQIGTGPGGIVAGPLQASVGDPLEINAWVTDDGKVSGMMAMMIQDGANPPVTLSWFKHQGPGHVEFSEDRHRIPSAGGVATAEVTFSEPGEYLLRAQLNEVGGPSMAGHSQCCWTNGFLRIEVVE